MALWRDHPGVRRARVPWSCGISTFEIPAVHGWGRHRAHGPTGESVPGAGDRAPDVVDPFIGTCTHARCARHHGQTVDALVPCSSRLHLVGSAWNDCSLSNVLFRRDAEAFAAYLVWMLRPGNCTSALRRASATTTSTSPTSTSRWRPVDLQAGGRLSRPRRRPSPTRSPCAMTAFWDEPDRRRARGGQNGWRIAPGTAPNTPRF